MKSFIATGAKALITVFIVCILGAVAQAADAQREYDRLAGQAMRSPETLDVGKIRELYAQLPYYSPYALDIPEDFKLFEQKFATKDPSADTVLKAYATKHVALPEIHSYAALLYGRTGDQAGYNRHMQLYNVLMQYLVKKGPPFSVENAIPVLTVSEESFFAHYYLQRVDGQDLRKEKNVAYDVLTGPGKQDGMPTELWFDITAPIASKKPL